MLFNLASLIYVKSLTLSSPDKDFFIKAFEYWQPMDCGI